MMCPLYMIVEDHRFGQFVSGKLGFVIVRPFKQNYIKLSYLKPAWKQGDNMKEMHDEVNKDNTMPGMDQSEDQVCFLTSCVTARKMNRCWSSSPASAPTPTWASHPIRRARRRGRTILDLYRRELWSGHEVGAIWQCSKPTLSI